MPDGMTKAGEIIILRTDVTGKQWIVMAYLSI
jgi:hypothetical protein